MCVGEWWCKKYSEQINSFSKLNKIHILTDLPKYFKECEVYEYTRNDFSYYEKINHVIRLSEIYKTRITYIDADWVSLIDTDILYDDNSWYCYNVFDLNSDIIQKYFTKENIKDIKKILSIIGLNEIGNRYVPEAIISIPYFENLKEIKKDINLLQTPLENMYNNIPQRSELKRYTENGVGYGEGWCLTAIIEKYKLKTNTFLDTKNKTWRKIGLI